MPIAPPIFAPFPKVFCLHSFDSFVFVAFAKITIFWIFTCTWFRDSAGLYLLSGVYVVERTGAQVKDIFQIWNCVGNFIWTPVRNTRYFWNIRAISKPYRNASFGNIFNIYTFAMWGLAHAERSLFRSCKYAVCEYYESYKKQGIYFQEKESVLAVLPNKIKRHDSNVGNATENSFIRTSTINEDF